MDLALNRWVQVLARDSMSISEGNTIYLAMLVSVGPALFVLSPCDPCCAVYET
jgi:hypothetical protein